MKNKLVKVWGIFLVLAVLAALLIPAAVPASAAVLDGTWSQQGAPSAIPFNVLAPNAAAPGNWLWDVAPDGKTMFAWDNLAAPSLYRSLDGGITWTKGAASVVATNSLAVFDVIPAAAAKALVISNDYANDATVILATPAVVYRSNNGGATFSSFATSATTFAGATITSVDVGADYRGGQAIVVGTSNLGVYTGKAYRYTASNPMWADLGFLPADFYGIALSVNYRTDAEVLAVATNAAGTYLWTKVATDPVNSTVLPVTLTAAIASVNTKVSFAFPADYNWSGANYVFLGIGDTAGVTNAVDDVWRIQGALPGGASSAYDLNLGGSSTNTNVYSISFKGNLGDGWLYVGRQDSNVVYRATSATSSTVTFTPSSKSPSGAVNTIVMASAVATDTNVWAMTSGAGSALNVSTDGGLNFNMMSLINISSSPNFKFRDLAQVDANNMFLLAWDDSGVVPGTYEAGERTFVFKTTNGGGAWQGIFVSASDMNKMYLSPGYAAATPDNTIFITETGNRIWKSSNGGLTFVGYSAGSIAAITAFAPVDANTYYVTGANAVSKGGFTNPATISGETPNAIAYVSPTDMFIGTQGGSVYRSLDGGLTFIPVGTPRVLGGQVNAIITDTAYATNNTIYVGLNGGGIWRWTVGTSATWTQILSSVVNAATPATTTTVIVNNLSQTGDGTMYAAVSVGVPTGLVTDSGTVMRCTAPTSPVTTWDRMTRLTGAPPRTFGLAGFVPDANGPAVVTVKAAATGTPQVPNNTVYAVVLQTVNTLVPPPPGADNRGSFIYAVKDTLVAAPAVTAPAANAQVATNVNFTWAPVATGYAPVAYDFQIAYDAAFTNTLVNASTSAPGTLLTSLSGTLYNPTAANGVSVLQPGQSYFWRVRVGNQVPMASKWSASTAFSVQLSNNNFDITGGGNRIEPAAGATDVPLKPVFQWAAVTGAVSYDLQVSDNPVFVNPLDAQTGLNTTVWTFTKTLDPGKTYYWRVRAVSASNVASAWVSSAFTTASGTAAPTGTAPAVVQPTFTITQPPAQTVVITQPPAQTVVITQAAATSTAPSTPASVWVLIAIGAILIIAVIVLIARTRRV